MAESEPPVLKELKFRETPDHDVILALNTATNGLAVAFLPRDHEKAPFQVPVELNEISDVFDHDPSLSAGRAEVLTTQEIKNLRQQIKD